MPSITAVAVQSMVLKMSANLVAQSVAVYKSPVPIEMDWQRVLEFAVFGFIQGNINFWWQHFLERQYPATRRTPSGTSGLSYRNLALKVLVDQTLGLLMMNTTLMVCTNIARQRSLAGLLAVVREKVPRIVFAAWRLWPAVSLLNFLYVPVSWRPVVGATVGFGWNMFLTFFMIK